jgi:hypothetical protein
MEVLFRSPPGNFQSSLRDFRPSNFYPGLRPGLSSAVPAGLILQSVFTQGLKPNSLSIFCGPTKGVPGYKTTFLRPTRLC